MTPKLAQYIEAGKALDDDERLEAAHQLLLSVDREDADQLEVDAAWAEAIEGRVDEIVNRRATLVDGPSAHAEVRATIASRRR